MIQVVVAYDIVDDRRRDRVAKCLKGYGVRVNYSVFECVVKRRAYLEMKKELRELMDEGEDSIRIYRVCRDCMEKAETMGAGPERFEAGAVLYV